MKINLGLEATKRGKFDKSKLCFTTSDFGFCQPIIGEYMMADTKIQNLSVHSAVRLAPLPCPTFGLVELRQYHHFVSMHDIFDSWEALQSGTPYVGSSSTYIPQELPSMPGYLPALLSAVHGNYTIYEHLPGPGLFEEFEPDLNTSLSDLNVPDIFLNSSTFITDVSKPPIPLTTADLVFKTGLKDQPFSNPFLIAIRLDQVGRRLRKVFLGLGYQLNFNVSTRVNILPLIAYYKCYYDRFFPQVGQTWKSTIAYKISREVVMNGITNIYSSSLFSDFVDFCDKELAFCYYTQNTDFFSAHQPGNTNLNSSDRLPYLDGSNTPNGATSAANKLPLTDNWNFDRVTFSVLDVFTKFLNKNSVLGGKVREYLRTHYGSDMYDDTSNFIGADTLSVAIDDVFATNESDSVTLGEFAGKSKGSGKSDDYSYNCKTAGYLISFICVVPAVSNYCQVYNPTLLALNKFQLPTPAFDSLGYEVTPSFVLAGDRRFGELRNDLISASFGMIPRYSAFKQSFDIVNGDMSLPQTRESLAPYHMERILNFDRTFVVGSGNRTAVVEGDESEIVCGTEWRYIGKDPGLGNYDRIFVNSGKDAYRPGLNFDKQLKDDNFIIDLYINLHILQPLKPMADSFDTDAFEKSIGVEKE